MKNKKQLWKMIWNGKMDCSEDTQINPKSRVNFLFFFAVSLFFSFLDVSLLCIVMSMLPEAFFSPAQCCLPTAMSSRYTGGNRNTLKTKEFVRNAPNVPASVDDVDVLMAAFVRASSMSWDVFGQFYNVRLCN